MRTIVMLWVVLLIAIGCGDDEIRTSPPVIDYLIIPKSVVVQIVHALIASG